MSQALTMLKSQDTFVDGEPACARDCKSSDRPCFAVKTAANR
jgi:hypothetical protein